MKHIISIVLMIVLTLAVVPLVHANEAEMGKVIAISGTKHYMALAEDGTVWTWGNNDYGQLGDGSQVSKTKAVKVKGLTGIVAISAGGSHSLAVKNDGTVWSWGNNDNGQLGIKDSAYSTQPVQVKELSDIIAISAGQSHSMALKKDGTVWSWGANDSGQLGDGTNNRSSVPVQAKGLTKVKKIQAGPFNGIALKEDTTVALWGYYSANTPVSLKNVWDATDIAYGGKRGGYPPIVGFLKDDGTYWVYDSWLGVQSWAESENKDFVSLTTGYGVKKDGSVWEIFRDNSMKQLQDISNVKAVAAGILPTDGSVLTEGTLITAVMVLKNDGTVWMLHDKSDPYAIAWMEYDGKKDLQAVESVDQNSSSAPALFTDMNGHWANEDVNKLVKLNILTGYGDGTFGPEDTVTREQFIKMIISSTYKEENFKKGIKTFRDVPQERWSNPYIETAVAWRILHMGDYGPNFEPEKPLTRIEMAILAARALGSYHPEVAQHIETFKDIEEINKSMRTVIKDTTHANNDVSAEIEGSKSEISSLMQDGIISGFPDGTFKPNEHVTRAQAATIVSKFVQRINK